MGTVVSRKLREIEDRRPRVESKGKFLSSTQPTGLKRNKSYSLCRTSHPTPKTRVCLGQRLGSSDTLKSVLCDGVKGVIILPSLLWTIFDLTRGRRVKYTTSSTGISHGHKHLSRNFYINPILLQESHPGSSWSELLYTPVLLNFWYTSVSVFVSVDGGFLSLESFFSWNDCGIRTCKSETSMFF